jgi:hypothetical protein
MRSHRRPLGASIVNKPFPKYHGSRWLFGASHDIFEERSFVMSPWDGSPEGNFFGAGIDDRRQRVLEAIDDANEREFVAPRTLPQLLAYVLSFAVFMFVMFYGTVG